MTSSLEPTGRVCASPATATGTPPATRRWARRWRRESKPFPDRSARRIPHELARAVDVAAGVAGPDLGEAAVEVEGLLELRIDHDLSFLVDVPPPAAQLDAREPFGER